jgi:hypothetical protein
MIALTAQAIARKFQAATPRERAGIALLAVVATAAAMIYALEWAGESAAQADVAAQEARERTAMVSTFSDEAFRRRLALAVGQAWRWGRSRDDMAREEMLGELEGLSLQAGFADAQVALLEPDPGEGRVSLQAATISAAFDWGCLIALLEAFESTEHSYLVQSIDVVGEAGAQRLTLIVAGTLLDEDDVR